PHVPAPFIALASGVPVVLLAVAISIAHLAGALDSPFGWRTAVVEQFERRVPVLPGSDSVDVFRAQRDVSGATGAVAYALSLLGEDTTGATIGLSESVQGMARIHAAAERVGLVVAPTVCDEPSLREGTKPLVVEAVPGHFVAVIGAEKRQLDVFDPATG